MFGWEDRKFICLIEKKKNERTEKCSSYKFTIISPLNATKKQHIFIAKNYVCENKKVTHFFSKNNCVCVSRKKKKKRSTGQRKKRARTMPMCTMHMRILVSSCIIFSPLILGGKHSGGFGEKTLGPHHTFSLPPPNQIPSKKSSLFIFSHFFSILPKIHSTKHTLIECTAKFFCSSWAKTSLETSLVPSVLAQR